jgi:hypothetical protein
MISGTRSMGDGRVEEALDSCLARLRRGESVDSCVSDYPQLAEDLRPLLDLAQLMQDSRITPPDQGPALARARERFMTAAAISFAVGGEREAVTAQHAATSKASEAEARTAEPAAAVATSSEPISDSVDVAVSDALDEGIARLDAGETVEAVLADHAEMADELEPLLAMAAAAISTTISPPRPPTDLARGRDRLLSAAADLEEQIAAAAAEADGDASLTAALDSCVSQLRSDADLEEVLAQHPHQARELRPLLLTVEDIRHHVVTAPESDLRSGRDRMLARATALRDADRVSVGDRVRSWFAPRRLSAAPRLAAALAVLALMLFAGAQFAGHVAADALPGERLYSVKRLNERVLLALTFDPTQRDQREAAFSQRRAEELMALVATGREAEVEHWKVRFREFVEVPRPNERRPVGWLLVVPLDDNQDHDTIKLRVEHDTKVDLKGQYGGWDELPPGTILVLHVETRDGEPPYVRAVVLYVDEGEEAGTQTPETQGTSEATNVPMQTTRPTTLPATQRPTETPVLSGTVTAAPLTPSPEPTETVEQTASPTPSAGIYNRKPTSRERAKLMGYVSEVLDTNTWIVVEQANDRSADRKAPEVKVDVSAIPVDRREQVTRGAWVQLFGQWLNDSMTHFYALRIDRIDTESESPAVPGSRCRGSSTIVGRVAEYEPRTSLTLVDGSRYDLTEVPLERIPADIAVGARVEIVYRVCEDGKRMATRITLLNARPPVRPYRGVIKNLGAEQFVLLTRQGTKHRVAYDSSTTIVGATELAVGQYVQVRGWSDATTGVIHAVEVRVAASRTTPTPRATVTPAPTRVGTASPEPVPSPTEQDGGGDQGAVLPGLLPPDLPVPPVSASGDE